MNVFITGATGFLGFHIAKECVECGYNVLCLKREGSVSKFPYKIEGRLRWVNKDDESLKEIVEKFRPHVLVHCAWEGVSSNERNSEYTQQHNLHLFMELINLYSYQQIIGLGSQDEYGFLDSVVDEQHPLKPETEYAKAKIACCKQLQSFSCKRGYEWQWIRVFNVYGEVQNENWIIPAVIRNCINKVDVFSTTKGEQQYAYLYAGDFAKGITSIIGKKNKSGIYNLSSSHPVSLQELLLTIKKIMESDIYIDFGAYPYRPNQSMLICGNSDKFIHAFGAFEKTSLEDGLTKTILSIL
ncbi:NAD-dependent epimerase/dehydratase family protein [Phocaeicola sp.]